MIVASGHVTPGEARTRIPCDDAIRACRRAALCSPPGRSLRGARLQAAAVAMETDTQGPFVLSNLAEVVERVLSFLPTKALLRAAW